MIPPEDDTTVDILTVGEVILDLIAPDAADLGSASRFLPSPGGAPANVAVAASRLGARAGFVGAVGNDPFGELLAGVLRENGVDPSHLLTVSERTTLAFVARNQGGIPDFVFYREADAALRPADIPVQAVSDARFLYVGSLALMSQPSRDATLYAVEVAHEAETLVAVDPNLRPSSWPSLQGALEQIEPLIRAADLLKISEEEARLFTDEPDLERAMKTLAREDALIVVTLGSEGCRWRWRDQSGLAVAPTVEVVETTGAGDAFMGALLAQLAFERWSPEHLAALDLANLDVALTFACAAGALACTKLGAMSSLPTREQVDQLLATHTPPRQRDTARRRGG